MRLPMISRPIKIVVAVFVVVALLVAAGGVITGAFYPGPAQPIPFSHRLHVTSKQINCFFCHQYATQSSNPGIPSVEKCVLCHQVIATQFPPIAQVLDYYDKGQSIPWVRVNRLADFVQFSHQAHLTSRIDCSRCHGNVKGMDRIKQANKFDMNFCITCHWENNASATCYACHY